MRDYSPLEVESTIRVVYIYTPYGKRYPHISDLLHT